MSISTHDRGIMSDLIAQVRDLAALPVQQERQRLWQGANSLQTKDRTLRPPIFVAIGNFAGDYEGGFLPSPTPQCEDATLHALEMSLRFTLFRHAFIPDDQPVGPPEVVITKIIRGWDDWGMQWKISERPVEGGAWHYAPVVQTPADLDRFRTPNLVYDDAATQVQSAQMQERVGDLLPVRIGDWWMPTIHLIGHWCLYRGLDQVMLDMYDEPEFLHAGMRIMADITRETLQQAEAMGVLPFSNGLVHATADLPQADDILRPVRLCDCMGWAESQELTGVSPAMHEEFALQYEQPLMELFGLSSYGCCEDLTHKIDMLRQVKNLRQIGVTPWADVRKCVEQIGTDYSISWRPNPAHLAGDFDEAFIRQYLRSNLESLRGTAFHIFLKDIHSCGGHPERLTRWTQICREELDRLWDNDVESEGATCGSRVTDNI